MKSNEELELEEYEKWVNDEIDKGHFTPVENFEEWKKALEEAASRTLEESKGKGKIWVTIEFSSPELKDEVVKLLKDRFGNQLKVITSNNAL